MVTSIAWSTLNDSENVTGPILLGTTRGLIFETEFDSGEDHMFTHNLEKYWRQVYDLGKGNSQNVHPVARPVTGLEYHRVKGQAKKYFIFATTSDRLYQFQGNSEDSDSRPLLINVFQSFATGPEQFLELPS